MAVGLVDGASSISVAIRVRPFTIREAAQLTKTDDTPLFLGDGSLAGVPTPKLGSKGIRSVIKVVDDKCLCVEQMYPRLVEFDQLTRPQRIRPSRRCASTAILAILYAVGEKSKRSDVCIRQGV